MNTEVKGFQTIPHLFWDWFTSSCQQTTLELEGVCGARLHAELMDLPHCRDHNGSVLFDNLGLTTFKCSNNFHHCYLVHAFCLHYLM